MKKRIKILSSIFIFPSLVLASCTNDGSSLTIEKINLDQADYVAEIIEINNEGYTAKIDNQNSFVLYIYSSSCSLCGQFTPMIQTVSTELDIRIYKETYTESAKNENLHSIAKYAPYVLIFKDGVYYTGLDSTSDSDEEYFYSQSKLNWWFTQLINLN
ncbi:MAG: thioredoxin family protein [Erysipelotrichaceae bacterium]|nr:thioredoxin family protein [Erysipelotrichaceae bacterium]